MIKTFTKTILILFFTYTASGQHDSVFVQGMATFDHRMNHPGIEDLGMLIENLDMEYDRHILDDYYKRIVKEKKEYIVSQIGAVDSELIFQQLIYNKYTEEEIYRLKDLFDPMDFTKPYGRQVKNITDYVDKKQKTLGKFFNPITIENQYQEKYTLPQVPQDKYILVHFWTSFCNNCKEKNQYFSDNVKAFEKSGVIVLNICTDYFSRNWQKVIEEKKYEGEHYYYNRRKFMDIAEKYILELSSTLLLDSDYNIVSREKYKLDELFDKTVFK